MGVCRKAQVNYYKTHDCNIYLASSKQKSRLCEAISADHTKLKKLVEQYNTVSTSASGPVILEEDIFSGQFVWSQQSGS